MSDAHQLEKNLAYVIDGLFLLIAPVHPALALIALLQYGLRRSVLISQGLLSLAHIKTISLPVLIVLPGAAALMPAATPTTKSAATASVADDDPFAPPAIMAEPANDLTSALATLPRTVTMRDLRPYPESKSAIPLGVDPRGAPRWIDFFAGALHIGLYGTSGSGKDTLLRIWFLWLAQRNSPEAVQFVFLDGKGDWLTPNLTRCAHMWRAPAGGYGAPGMAAIREAIGAIDAEAGRRQQIIFSAGYRTRERYVEATGAAMPLLIVVASDVMDAVADEVETLLISLVSKARALGIRVVVSMQTPTGKNMQWRTNLSTVLSGSLQDRSQDAPALGLNEKALRYRPSLLPPPGVRPGVFVARSGGEQLLVQAPYLAEETFDRWVNEMPQRSVSGISGADLVEPGSVPSEPGSGGFGLPNAGSGLGSVQFSDPDPLESTLPASRTELANLMKALTHYQQTGKETEAIEQAFNVRKGSSKEYQRARALFKTALQEA